MSLGLVIKGPEGLVLSAESRVTLTHRTQGGETIFSTFDNATKLLTFTGRHKHVGAVTFGIASIGLRTASSYIPEIETELPGERISVEDFANRLSAFFVKQWDLEYKGKNNPPAGNMTFVVAGFDEGSSYGTVLQFEIPQKPNPAKQHETGDGSEGFGLVWGGQREFVAFALQAVSVEFAKVCVAYLRS